MTADLGRVAGIAETALAPEAAAALPTAPPGPPWSVRFRAVWWWSADRELREAARDALPATMRTPRAPLAVCAGLLRYAETPAGPYDEVFGGVSLWWRGRPRLHVPFMAVDSAPSLVGGRVGWGFPKVLCAFDGAPASAATMRARADSWEVTATPEVRGPALPALLPPCTAVQIRPDGDLWITPMRGRARVRRARLEVAVTGSPSLTSWLPAGHASGVLVESAHATFGHPRRA